MRSYAALLTIFFLAIAGSLPAQWDTLNFHGPSIALNAATRFNDRLIAAHASGISYSDNAGDSWTLAPGSPANAYEVWTRQDKVYAVRVQNGLDSAWVSNDGGQTFEPWGAVIGFSNASKVIRGDTMFAVLAGGGGVNTESVLRFIRGNPDAEILFTCPGFAYNLQIVEMGNRLILLSTDGIRWSDDSGLNWQKSAAIIPINNQAPGYDRLRIQGNALFYYNRVGNLLRSDDAGQNWTDLPFFVNQSSFILDMSNEGNDLLIGARQNPASSPYRINWRSSDLGQSWTPVYPQVFLLESILQSYDTPAGKRIMTNQGCYAVSQNDQLWETRTDGLPLSPVFQILKTGPDSWVTGDQFKLYVTEDDGQHWRLSWYDEAAFLDGLYLVGNTILARIGQPGLLRSDDLGQSWYPEIPPTGSIVQAFCQLDDSNVLAVLPPGELYRYEVPAKTWHLLGTIGDVQKLATLNGVVFTEGFNCVRASTDMGQSFVELKNGLPLTFVCYNIFSVGTRLFTVDYNNAGLYVSNNLGLSWEFSPGPASDLYLPFINRLTGDGEVLLAANMSKVYVTDGGGDQWFASDVPVQGFGYVEVFFLGSFEDFVYLCFSSNQRTYFLRRKITSLAFEKLKGRVYEDTNNNQSPDPGEPGIPNALVYTLNGQHYVLTDTSGRYSLPFTPPQDSVLVTPFFLAYTSTPSGYSVSQSADSLDFAIFTDLQDFRLILENNSLPRPGFQQRLTLHLLNAGLYPEDAQVKALLDPRLQVLETTPPATLSGDTLIWSLTAVPAYIPQILIIDAVLDNTALLGSILEANAWVTMTSDIDDFPENNADTLQQTIVGSYDPNDKTAISGDIVLKTSVEAGAPLDYIIRFQNTGNYPAEFVHILDTLESDFDPLSFALEAASHPVQVRFAQPRVLDFFFNHIQLPDSISDEPGSHGFVRYSIAPYRNLAIGDSLENRAAIYFDYNLPVITNTALTVVSEDSGTDQGIKKIQFKIQPNPVAAEQKSTLVLSAPASSPVRLQLFDISGRKVKEWYAPTGTEQVSLPGLPAGAYTVQLNMGNRIGVGLLLVE